MQFFLFNVVPGQHGCPDGSGYIEMWRNMNLFAGNFFEGCYHGLVVGYSTLEEDVLTHSFFPYYLLDIIMNDGVGQASHQVIFFNSFLLKGIQVRLHKHGTAVSQSGRLTGTKGHFTKFLNDIDVQFLGLLLEEGTCSCSTNFVHLKIDDHAIINADVLGILSPDLKNGIHLGIKGDGSCGLGSNFVADQICPDEVSRQVAARSCGSGAFNHYPVSHLLMDL